MTSTPNWALYATTYRRGTFREHRLAGARLRAVGVTLEFSVPTGWKASVHVGRSSLTVTKGLADSDPRVDEYLDAILRPVSESAP